MESIVETKYGTVTVRNAMLDVNGTDLESGVEIKLDGKLIGELVGESFDIDDYDEDEIEEAIELVEGWIEDHCEY